MVSSHVSDVHDSIFALDSDEGPRNIYIYFNITVNLLDTNSQSEA